MTAQGFDKERAQGVLDLIPYINRYKDFKILVSLGLTVRPDDLDFEKGLIFGWIEAGHGRNN